MQVKTNSNSNMLRLDFKHEGLVSAADLEMGYSVYDEVIKHSLGSINRQFKNQIKAALKVYGFEFETENEFINFAKDRCTCVTLPSKQKVLVVDEAVSVCSWIDEYDVFYDGSQITVNYNRQYKP